MKISKEDLMENFLRFAESETDLDNISEWIVSDAEWEELVNQYLTDKFYDIETEEDLEELNEAEDYIRSALKLNK